MNEVHVIPFAMLARRAIIVRAKSRVQGVTPEWQKSGQRCRQDSRGLSSVDAVRKAVDRTLSATAQGGDRKAGVIWPVPMLMMVMPR